MNSMLSAIKAFVLKSRPAYKDYLGNGKYDVKKLPEECVPDSVTLPKGGNPGDILVKTETGSAWEKQEPATSTPDYNQNDPTARDYIKNRPGGYTVNYPALNIEWDGVIGDRVSVDFMDGKFVKVSDEIPKVEQLWGAALTVKIGDKYHTLYVDDKDIEDNGNGIYGVIGA